MDIEYIQSWIYRYRFLLIIIFVVITAGLVGITSIQNYRDAHIAKETINKVVDPAEFEIKKVLLSNEGWKYVQIAYTQGELKGTTAVAILHDEADRTVLKVGPGTSLSKSVMKNAGVPNNIQAEILRISL